MNKLLTQLKQFIDKYSTYVTLLVANMRLVLLIAFGILCGILAIQVNSIIDETNTATPDSSQNITSKKPDSGVISVFNELQAQDVQIDSQFDTNRNNPF